MPHFTRQVDAKGLTINAIFTVSDARAEALRSVNLQVPNPVVVQGLVDTGASHTCVTPDIIQALDIFPIDATNVLTPSGSMAVNLYDIGLTIYSTEEEVPYRIPNLTVSVAEALLRQDLRCLIGMDVLSRCLLMYNGVTGLYTLAF